MRVQDGLQRLDGTVRSFLTVGQSNMAGRGKIGEVPAISDADCYMLRMGRWQPLSEPVNPDRAITGNFSSGISLTASFALAYREFTQQKTGIIPCADGGTKIAQWQPGEILFDHAVTMTRLAQRSSVLQGVLWHQGESDCHDLNEEVYANALGRVIEGLRQALDAPTLPFVAGEISEQIEDARWKVGEDPVRMNALLHRLEKEIPYFAVTPAKDLPLQADGIHFSAASLRILGQRYFETYRSLI